LATLSKKELAKQGAEVEVAEVVAAVVVEV